jgi:hypothetical protein
MNVTGGGGASRQAFAQVSRIAGHGIRLSTN